MVAPLCDLPPGPLAEADEEGGVEDAEDPAEAGGDAHGVGEGVPGRPLQPRQGVVVAVQRALRLGQRHARRARRGRLLHGGKESEHLKTFYSKPATHPASKASRGDNKYR